MAETNMFRGEVRRQACTGPSQTLLFRTRQDQVLESSRRDFSVVDCEGVPARFVLGQKVLKRVEGRESTFWKQAKDFFCRHRTPVGSCDTNKGSNYGPRIGTRVTSLRDAHKTGYDILVCKRSGRGILRSISDIWPLSRFGLPGSA